MISPGDSATVTVTADLDDTAAFADELILDVTESPAVRVPLNARGSGTPLQPDVDLAGAGLDFGPVFTAAEHSRAVTVENRGRRQLALSWVNTTVRGEAGDAGATASGGEASKKAGRAAAGDAAPPPFVFVVEPQLATVKPGGSATFVVKW